MPREAAARQIQPEELSDEQVEDEREKQTVENLIGQIEYPGNKAFLMDFMDSDDFLKSDSEIADLFHKHFYGGLTEEEKVAAMANAKIKEAYQNDLGIIFNICEKLRKAE